MDHTRRVRQFCAALLLLAVVFRLWTAGFPAGLKQWLSQPDTVRLLIYLETGRIVRFSSSEAVLPAFFRESAPPVPPRKVPPVFSEEDASLIQYSYLCQLRPDTPALLTAPLAWQLKGAAPTVLITHTHTTESYTPSGEVYEESSPFRTLEARYNMLCIGDRVAELLEEAGIGVVHDRTIHDHPSYNGSYTHARKTLQALLEEHPSIVLVLDLHRDAAGTTGAQLRTEVTTGDQPCAQLMLVMGTGAGGLPHDNWEENLALALKLQATLEQAVPGIMRPISLRAQRFNQDLCPGALLVEVGAAGNTREEALRAAEYLAAGVIALSDGANFEN